MFNNYNQTLNDDFLGQNATVKEFDYDSFYRAYVESIEDPQNLGRVKIRIPYLHSQASVEELPYAYPAINAGFGNQVGQFLLPPVGSIVFVAFEYSDEHRPIYFGGIPTVYAEGKKDQYYGSRINKDSSIMVTTDDIPTEYTGSQYIIYKSPSGSIIYIDDTDLGPQIVVKDSIGQEIRFVSNEITEQDAKGCILIKHDKDNLIRVGKNNVTIRVAGIDYPVPWETGGGGTTDFNLLINKPVLNTDNSTTLPANAKEEISGTINLHKVSKTGMYKDLIGLPTIPDEQVNSDWNSTSGKSMIYNKPTNLSQFNNDTNFITSADIPEQVNSDWNSTEGPSQILNKPTNLSQFNNDSNFITINEVPEQVNSDWNSDSGKSQILNKPTNLSQFNNDSGFLDEDSVLNIDGLEKTSNKVSLSSSSTETQYPNAKSVYDFVMSTVETLPQGLKIPISIQLESSLPSTAEDGDYYFIQNMDITAPDRTGRAWWNNGQWYKVFDQYQSMDGVSIVQTGGGSWQVSTEWLHGVLNLATVATSGKYSDLSGTPTNLSQFNNDSGFITSDEIPEQVNSDWNSNSGKSQILNKPEFKTINNQSIIGTGNINITGSDYDAAPVGAMFDYPSLTPPTGYMIRDGRELSRTEYADLFSVIGTTYGEGDGSTTFNIPNSLGRLSIGYNSDDSDFDALGKTGGSKTHTQTIEELAKHNHIINSSTGAGNPIVVYADGMPTPSPGSTNYALKYTGVTNDSAPYMRTNVNGNGKPMDIMNPYIVSCPIIKVTGTAILNGNVIDSLSEDSSTNAPSQRAVNEKIKELSSGGNSNGLIYDELPDTTSEQRLIEIPNITSYEQLLNTTIKVKTNLTGSSVRPSLNINGLGPIPLRIPSSSKGVMSSEFKDNWVNANQVYEVAFNKDTTTFDLLNSNIVDLADDNDAILGTNSTKPVTPHSLEAAFNSKNLVYSSDDSIDNIVTVTLQQYLDMQSSGLLDENTYYNVLDGGVSASTSVPVGTIMIWPASLDELPSNMMQAAGQELNISDYPALFARYGTTYGGDGITTFNLPDYSGLTIVGLDKSDSDFGTLGNKVGEKEHKLSRAELPHFGGTLNFHGSGGQGTVLNGTSGDFQQQLIKNQYVVGTLASGAPSVGVVALNIGSDQSHNNVQPSAVAYYVVKVKEDAHTEDMINLDSKVAALEEQVYYNLEDEAETPTGRKVYGKPEYIKRFHFTGLNSQGAATYTKSLGFALSSILPTNLDGLTLSNSLNYFRFSSSDSDAAKCRVSLTDSNDSVTLYTYNQNLSEAWVDVYYIYK